MSVNIITFEGANIVEKGASDWRRSLGNIFPIDHPLHWNRQHVTLNRVDIFSVMLARVSGATSLPIGLDFAWSEAPDTTHCQGP